MFLAQYNTVWLQKGYKSLVKIVFFKYSDLAQRLDHIGMPDVGKNCPAGKAMFPAQ